MSKFGGRKGLMPEDLGRAFWQRLLHTQPPLIDVAELDVLKCPVSPSDVQDDCQYLGPVSSANQLSSGDPLGCDDYENHGPDPPGSAGGNILRKSGDVLEDNGPLWEACAKTQLKCRR
jgi:hypothetical protein